MLGNTDVVANVAVKDLGVARRFYTEMLGLTQDSTYGDELMSLRSGNSTFSVYRSEYAGSNQATALTWDVGDRFDEVVTALKDSGVNFEHYDIPEMTREGDIHVAGEFKAAWFKDPDGNILNVINGKM